MQVSWEPLSFFLTSTMNTRMCINTSFAHWKCIDVSSIDWRYDLRLCPFVTERLACFMRLWLWLWLYLRELHQDILCSSSRRAELELAAGCCACALSSDANDTAAGSGRIRLWFCWAFRAGGLAIVDLQVQFCLFWFVLPATVVLPLSVSEEQHHWLKLLLSSGNLWVVRHEWGKNRDKYEPEEPMGRSAGWTL